MLQSCVLHSIRSILFGMRANVDQFNIFAPSIPLLLFYFCISHLATKRAQTHAWTKAFGETHPIFFWNVIGITLTATAMVTATKHYNRIIRCITTLFAIYFDMVSLMPVWCSQKWNTNNLWTQNGFNDRKCRKCKENERSRWPPLVRII